MWKLLVSLVIVAGIAGVAGAPARADDAGDRGPGLITTHATARGRLANTVADVSIGVTTHQPSVAATQSALAASSDRLIGYLRQQAGVERLRTEQLSITPQTVAEKGQAERIIGYDGRMLASFRVPSERLGAVVAGAMANGGNELRDTALRPREKELDDERGRLSAEAARTALAEAATVAEATGRQLGSIWRIEVDPGRNGVGPVPMMRVAAAPAATEAGEAEVTASVMVTVALVERK